MQQQVEKKHYGLSYGFVARFASYHYQVREVASLEPENVLEIGVGDGVFGHYLQKQLGIPYTSVDIAADLEPDIVGSVTELPLADGAYDVVAAFEVLEHLPFDQFEPALRELARVARKAVIISIPHFGPPIRLLLKIPFLPEIRFAVKVPVPLKHEFNGEHYWEVGKRGYGVRLIRKRIASIMDIEKEFVPFEHQYHRFYVCRVHA